jgi:hypothetical protein
MEYIKTSLSPIEIQNLNHVKVKLPDGTVIDAKFDVLSENNQGKEIVVEYAITGRIQYPPKRRAVAQPEWEQWRKDPTFLFCVAQ